MTGKAVTKQFRYAWDPYDLHCSYGSRAALQRPMISEVFLYTRIGRMHIDVGRRAPRLRPFHVFGMTVRKGKVCSTQVSSCSDGANSSIHLIPY